MSVVILPQINGSLVGYKAQGSNFLALVQQTLGNAGTSADGWDAAINAVISLFPSTDAGFAALDSTYSAIVAAVDAFDAIDTTAPFLNFVGALPALESLVGSGKLQPVGPLSLPSLPPAPTPQPPPKPPTVCVPAPPPPAPTPTPTPAPAPTPTQPPCPQGWAFVAGKCQPPPIPRPSTPGAPPVVLPPLPAGLPPCPPSGFSSPGIPCKNMAGAPASDATFALKVGTATLSMITTAEVTSATTAFVGTFGFTALAALPLVGAIIGVAALLWFMFGGGCGEACIDASKIEQVYEAVSDNLYLIARAGMILPAEAVVGQSHFQSVGMEAEDRLGTPASFNGKENIWNVINAEIAATKLLPATVTQPLTLAAARALYVGGVGWYPDSIATASQLTDHFVAGYIQAQ